MKRVLTQSADKISSDSDDHFTRGGRPSRLPNVSGHSRGVEYIVVAFVALLEILSIIIYSYITRT